MARVLVSGLINIETTLRVDGFPIDYTPVRYPFWGVKTTVSGVGYNVARALTTLGHECRFVSLIGREMYEDVVREALERDGIDGAFVRAELAQTAQSVILYNQAGRRQINVDLKDIQERVYPPDAFAAAAAGCDLAVLCNINFSRPFLARARALGIPVATDVHTIGDLDDAYNRDFLAGADIVFMSDEALPASPERWASQVLDRYGPEIVVIGLGKAGALLATQRPGRIVRLPAVETRPVVNTIGAGDALFSAFVHATLQGHDSEAALARAIVFASYKIGESGAAEGFLSAPDLAAWYERISRNA